MNSNIKPVKVLFILGAISVIIASYLKISNIGIADYMLALGVSLMVLAAAILYLKYRN